MNKRKKVTSARQHKGFTAQDSIRVIRELGGADSVAKGLSVSRSTVTTWLSRGIPRPWAIYLNDKLGDLVEMPAIANPPNMCALREALSRTEQAPNAPESRVSAQGGHLVGKP